MSDRIRISRRRVMQMGIAAPLIAMEARGADPAALEAEAMKLLRVPFPESKLTEFKTRGKEFCANKKNHCDGFDETEYGLIALLLWDQFCGGVESGGAKVPDTNPQLSKLLDAAYAATSKTTTAGTSGELIASRVANWGNKYKNVTNYCAFRCGIHAAQSAGIGMKIEPKDYKTAFVRTSDEMQALVARIRPPMDRDEEPRIRGGGC